LRKAEGFSNKLRGATKSPVEAPWKELCDTRKWGGTLILRLTKPLSLMVATMSWKNIGAGPISRVCGVYELLDTRLPTGKYKIKVLEREDDFVAHPNVSIRSSDGVAEWTCGLGESEVLALQDAIKYLSEDLSLRDNWPEEDLEWSDPRDF
jgi:hypothetical protein